MWHRVVHTADPAVLRYVEVLQEGDNGVGVVFTHGVRLAYVHEEVVPVGVVVVGVVGNRVWGREDPPPGHHAHPRPVPCEVEEGARFGQPPELLRSEVLLETGQPQGSNPPHVDPWPKHGDCAGVLELRDRLYDLKLAYQHGCILPDGWDYFKVPTTASPCPIIPKNGRPDASDSKPL